MTLNGLGHQAWSRACNKYLTVDSQKLWNLLKQLPLQLTKAHGAQLVSVVTAAMQAGLVPDKYPHKSLVPDTKETWEEFQAKQEKQMREAQEQATRHPAQH
jgi:hypothetical protein